jgi:hypothetical protein
VRATTYDAGKSVLSAVGVSEAVRAKLDRSVTRLEAYLEREEYRGWDPYDALTSPLFRLPVLRSSKWPRLGATQILKRAPVNLRPLLRIPKGYNPVTLAFVLEASAYRATADPDGRGRHLERAQVCIAELARLRTPGFSGDCWGYPFDWEARYGRLPAGTPTIVATGIVTNALWVAYRLLGLERGLEMCTSAASFVLNDLPRRFEGDSFCWGYYPHDGQRVLNATMKGARLCAQVYSVTQDDRYLVPAAQTAAYVARHQRPDGSWPYAVGDTRRWADSFHTAYVLDAYDSYRRLTGDEAFRDAQERGWAYYRAAFFSDAGVPRYFPEKAFPIDATVCAQSLLTLCHFGDVEAASGVADWAIRHLQSDDGSFHYQRRRRGLVRIPYMRWSSAYMYDGLSRLALALSGGTTSMTPGASH